MLIIKEIEILNNHKFNIKKRKTKKRQILLYDTQRRADDFLAKLVNRYCGKYDNIPHYIVTKLGHVIEVLDSNYATKIFGDNKLDNKLITVAVENLGWLTKNTITGYLNNWIGDPYRSEPYIKDWRDHYFWDRYNKEQFETIRELCLNLCDKHQIPFKSVPSNGYLQNISKFNGISCKSNYSNIYTHINPSFDFKIFIAHEEKNSGI
jgi:hypothetical protein